MPLTEAEEFELLSLERERAVAGGAQIPELPTPQEPVDNSRYNTPVLGPIRAFMDMSDVIGPANTAQVAAEGVGDFVAQGFQSDVGQGAVQAGADWFGMPVDLTTMGVNAAISLPNMFGAGLPGIQNPVGGSQNIGEFLDVYQDPSDASLAYNVARFGLGAGMGAVGLASRAKSVPGTISTMTQSKPAQIADTVAQQYAVSPGRQIAVDITGGAGAGAGITLGQEVAPDNPYVQLGSALAGGVGGSVGADTSINLSNNILRGVQGAANNIATGNTNKTIMLPDGTEVDREMFMDAAQMMQANAVDPEKASATLTQTMAESAEGGLPNVPAGAASGDVGLGATEKGMRVNNPVPFVQRDKEVNTAISRSVEDLADPNADVTAPQQAAQAQATQQRQAADAQVDAAVQQRRDLDVQGQDIEADRDIAVAPIRAERGAQNRASEQLNEQIGTQGALGERTAAKNQRFEASYQTADGATKRMDVTPIKQSVDSINAEINRLGYENTGLSKEFANRVQRLAKEPPSPDGEIPAQGFDPSVDMQEIGRLNRDLTRAVRDAERRGNYELAGELKDLKTSVRTTLRNDPDYLEADSFYQETYAPFFAEGYGRKFRDTTFQGDGTGQSDPGRVADLFLDNTRDAAEDLADIVAIAPNTQAAQSAVKRYMAADLANSLGEKPTARTLTMWMQRRADQLDQFPEVKAEFEQYKKQLGSVDARKSELDDLITTADQQLRKAEGDKQITEQRLNSGAFRVLTGSDPDRYARDLMSGNDRLQKADEALQIVKGNKKAEEGLKQAITKELTRKITGTNRGGVDMDEVDIGPVGYAKVAKVLNEEKPFLEKFYTPEEMNTLERGRKMLEQYGNVRVPATSQSDTKVNETVKKLTDVAEVALKAKYGVLKGGGILRTVRIAANRLLPDNRYAMDELLTQAFLDPRITKMMLDTPVAAVGTDTFNRDLTKLLSYGEFIRENVDEDEETN